MSNLGFGVMIGLLAGNEETVETFNQAVGKTISNVEVNDDSELVFIFTDNTAIKLFDDGQDCCENRWMHTDDDLSYFVGSTLQEAKVGEGPTENEDSEPKESQFLIITTSKGQFTVVNYNEHNGSYGGFLIRCQEVKK